MRVLHISATDVVGGAAVSAWRLHQALVEHGVNSRMLVERKTVSDAEVIEAALPHFAQTLWRPLTEGQVWQNRTALSETYFSPGYPGRDISEHPEVQAADILHLHWVSDFLSPMSVAKLTRGPRPIVWTLHDQRPLTGGCHFSAGCDGYEDCCSPCPQLRNQLGEWPARNLSDMRHLYRSGQVTLVSPSRWLDSCARASSVFRESKKLLIPYGVPRQHFHPVDRLEARRQVGISSEGFYVLFGAVTVNERRKGLREFLEAAKRLLKKTSARFLVFGNHAGSLSELGAAVVPLGFLRGPEQLRNAYAAADVFALTSLEDNLPNTMLEAMACGTPVVGFNVGGVPDAVKPDLNGQLVEKGDIEGFADALLGYASDPGAVHGHGREAARTVDSEFSVELQAQRCLSLYREIQPLPEDPECGVPVLGPSVRRGLARLAAGAALNVTAALGMKLRSKCTASSSQEPA